VLRVGVLVEWNGRVHRIALRGGERMLELEVLMFAAALVVKRGNL
jgi:hypothetical protein